jgi:broad specificity phosphatase PhoE
MTGGAAANGRDEDERAETAAPLESLGTGRRLWLFRHAEVHEEWQGKAYGGLDVPLSARGEADTVCVAERFGGLPFRAVLCSNLSRARRLGELLAQRSGAPLQVHAGLAEIARGRWQGRTVAELHEQAAEEVAAFYADPWRYCGHGGETDRDVLRRAWPVVAEALRASPGDGRPLAVAAHYNVVRVLVARALGIEPALSFRLRIDCGALTVLRDDPRGWVLERLNVRDLGGGGA